MTWTEYGWYRLPRQHDYQKDREKELREQERCMATHRRRVSRECHARPNDHHHRFDQIALDSGHKAKHLESGCGGEFDDEVVEFDCYAVVSWDFEETLLDRIAEEQLSAKRW